MFFPIVATFRSTADTKLGKTSCRLENVANVDVGSSTFKVGMNTEVVLLSCSMRTVTEDGLLRSVAEER
jgi:hypothetical protein